MRRTKSSSSSPAPERLVRVPLDHLRPHPSNPNRMDEERLTKLAENIRRQDDYPPLVVRPDPDEAGCLQLLDGHQRWEVLRRLGHADALCYVWPCDDRTALLLLATLNRLEGQDDPLKRAELLRELTALASAEELALLLPEDANTLRRSLELLDLDLDALLADLTGGGGGGSDLRAITFAVSAEDEARIEAAVDAAVADLEGANRRGRALGAIAGAFMEGKVS